MKAFRFPLDRVLQWRTTQCEMEDAATARLLGYRAKLAADLVQIASERKSASREIASQPLVDSSDFQTLAGFNSRLDQHTLRIRANAKIVEREIAKQLERTAEAKRKQKLLETLRSSRLQEWTKLRDSEEEQAGTDSWLARFVTESYTTTNAPQARLQSHPLRSLARSETPADL